jgi:hypothetical protein
MGNYSDLHSQAPPMALLDFGLFWFLCGNEVYTDSFFSKIAIKVLPDKYFTIP